MPVTYDSIDILTGNYKVSVLGQDSSPENIINSLKPARDDGIIIISSNYDAKYIDIAGRIIGTTQANLETNIDSFKELISRKDKNLDISYAGGTRRYVCRSIICDVTRDFYNITFSPYRIRFVVSNGYGSDTGATTAFSSAGIVATPDTQVYTFLGSYQAKPTHKVSINTRGNADVIRIENDTTGDYMDVDLGSNPSYIEINEENLTVLNNSGAAIDYRGKFPSVDLGVATTFKLYVYGSGSILDQQQATTSVSQAVFWDNGARNPLQAQSFIPSQSGRVHKFTVYIGKVDGGTLSGAMEFGIYSDDNNKPGTMLGPGFTYDIAEASVTIALSWQDIIWGGTDLQRPFLTANTRYWLVYDATGHTGSDVDNYFTWGHDGGDGTGYTSGKAMFAINSAGTWYDGIANPGSGGGGDISQKDMCFKEYRGVDGGVVTWDVSWLCTYIKKYL